MVNNAHYVPNGPVYFQYPLYTQLSCNALGEFKQLFHPLSLPVKMASGMWHCVDTYEHHFTVLDNEQLDTHLLLFYNMFIIILYMFQTLYAHHQEVELYWCSIWYHTLSKWPSSAPDSHWLRVQYQMLHQYNSTSSWWAYNAWNM